MKKHVAVSLTLIALLGVFKSRDAEAYHYETYLESWDSNWQNVLQNLPGGYSNVVLDLCFACYNFPGLNGLQAADPTTVVDFVHTHGGKVKISFGGASTAAPCAPNYFISQTPGWPSNAGALAFGVANVVSVNNFDGVDFDIEDTQPTYAGAQQFANDLIGFLKQVRSFLPGKLISITIPAQGWSGPSYWYYLATGAAAVPGLIDSINFMEYDIWINTGAGLTYAQQIQADLVTYTSSPMTSPAPNWSPGWGLSPSIVQVGLMPGCDDQQHFLSVADATSISQTIASGNYYGVMTWDLNRDAGSSLSPSCSSYPSNYQYSQAIRQALSNTAITGFVGSPYRQKHRQAPIFNFIKNNPPSHGAP